MKAKTSVNAACTHHFKSRTSPAEFTAPFSAPNPHVADGHSSDTGSRDHSLAQRRISRSTGMVSSDPQGCQAADSRKRIVCLVLQLDYSSGPHLSGVEASADDPTRPHRCISSCAFTVLSHSVERAQMYRTTHPGMASSGSVERSSRHCSDCAMESRCWDAASSTGLPQKKCATGLMTIFMRVQNNKVVAWSSSASSPVTGRLSRPLLEELFTSTHPSK